jgi:ketosteroid isomerase-like protein
MRPADQVKAAEAARCAAMLAGDVAGLDGLLAEGLTFVHSNGGVDGKSALLKKMAAGAIAYQAIDWSEPQVDVRGAVAALHGIMALQVTVAGVAKTLRNRAILLWEYDSAAWRLFYFQSTPIPQPG